MGRVNGREGSARGEILVANAVLVHMSVGGLEELGLAGRHGRGIKGHRDLLYEDLNKGTTLQ